MSVLFFYTDRYRNMEEAVLISSESEPPSPDKRSDVSVLSPLSLSSGGSSPEKDVVVLSSDTDSIGTPRKLKRTKLSFDRYFVCDIPSVCESQGHTNLLGLEQYRWLQGSIGQFDNDNNTS